MDFPVQLVKGDVEYTASTAVDYVNAVFGAGFTLADTDSPYADVPDATVLVADEPVEPVDAPVETDDSGDPETDPEAPAEGVKVSRPRKPREGATA